MIKRNMKLIKDFIAGFIEGFTYASVLVLGLAIVLIVTLGLIASNLFENVRLNLNR